MEVWDCSEKSGAGQDEDKQPNSEESLSTDEAFGLKTCPVQGQGQGQGHAAVSDTNQGTLSPVAVCEKGKVDHDNDGPGAKAPPIRFEFHFPEEVWLMILDLVSDEDKVNCCRAIPYLDGILIKSKPVFLAEQVLPLLSKWMSNNQLFQSREVCTKWCSGVEKLLYTKRALLSEIHNNILHIFSNEEDVEKFMEKFAGHSRSPFMDGAIYVMNGDGVMQVNHVEFLEGLLNLLHRFGKYIKIMDIIEFLPEIAPLTWYRFIQEALTNTPNLRQLRIFEPALLDEPEEPVELHDINELCTYMVLNPLPFIPSLDVVCMHNGQDTNATFQSIHNMIIQPYAGQLKTLSVDAYNWKDHYAPGLVNLTELQLASVESDGELEQLTLLPTTPLQSLTLEIIDDISVPALLGVLKHFSLLTEALFYFESVEEKFTNGQDISSLDHQHHLKVPSIKSLEIHGGSTLAYNFLQLFSGLRRLIVSVHEEMDIDVSADGEGEGDLQLYKIVRDGKIYESNIWSLIPTLRCLKISTGDGIVISGTRDGYNATSYKVS